MGWRFGFLGVFALGVWAASATAAEACSNYRTDSLFVGDSIGLVFRQSPGGKAGKIATNALEAAVGMWQGCDNYGKGFPRFLIGSEGTRTLEVDYLPEVAGDEVCGTFGQEKIVIFGYQRVSGELFSCGDLIQNLAHELGHALGLSEASSALRCQLHVMSWITADNAYRRAVQPAECMAVGQRWLTFGELGTVQASVDLTAASLTVGRSR